MKILALDLGDVWTGSAISDRDHLVATPYQTVKTNDLEGFLEKVIADESVATIVVGYPKTLKGGQSEQTNKVIALKSSLEKKFDTVTWELWDERLTSRQAAQIKKAKNKEDKIKLHSIAAALILSGFLEFKRLQK